MGYINYVWISILFVLDDIDRCTPNCNASALSESRRVLKTTLEIAVMKISLLGIGGSGWALVSAHVVIVLPAIYNAIAQTIDPLVASVSAVLIVGTVLLMFVLDRLVGLDRILIGEVR